MEPTPVVPPEQASPVTEPVPSPRKRVAPYLIGVGTVVVLAGAIAISLLQPKPSRPAFQALPAPTPAQVVTDPASGAKVTLDPSAFYSIGSDKTYYGQVTRINQNFIRMQPSAYFTTAASLTVTGDELHGPEPATFFNEANIKDLHALKPSVPSDKTIIDALTPYGATIPASSQDISGYLNPKEYQAFFFKDGTGYFARVTNLNGYFLTGAGHVFTLQTDGSVALKRAKPEAYASYTSDDLLYWQNLKTTGKVSAAITLYESKAQ
jgi:hypothetical protein